MENEYKNIKFILFLLNFNKFVNKNQLLYFYHINYKLNFYSNLIIIKKYIYL